MNSDWSEENLRQLARQLSCPDGEAGLVTGERMSAANSNIIRRTIELLSVKAGERIAEIGPGNGSHVRDLLTKAAHVTYTGVDISATMIQAAQTINADLVASGQVGFVLSDGQSLTFSANSFDKLFTVNTVYFWEDPAQYANEVYRVLKPGGRFYVAFAHRDFMERLPFTQYGFRLYNSGEVEQMLRNASFQIEQTVQETDQTIGNLGQIVERDIIIVEATKPF